MLKLELLLMLHTVKNKIEARISKGFTLAEILITLLIIGVVASMVIPALIQDTQQQEYITSYKKAFADINQALLRAKNNYELVDINSSLDNVVTNIRTMENYFVVTKSCTNAVNQGCWIDNCNIGEHDCFWALPSNDSQGKSEGFVDNSGRQWIHYKTNAGVFIMIVDINGSKKPNRLGRDRFILLFFDENSSTSAKAPIKIMPYPDEVSKVSNTCSFGDCYYTSWLKK